jgi:hypothetical protein
MEGRLMALGEITLPGYRFKAHRAKMWRFRVDDEVNEEGEYYFKPRAGWGFEIAAGAPVEEAPGDDRHLFDDGICLECEDEPVQLPEVEDLTGVDFHLRRTFHPESGEGYFWFLCPENKDVSNVRIRFLERNGTQYRIELTATVHRVLGRRAEFRYVGWIKVTRRPAE